jgi:hypothetical protein
VNDSQVRFCQSRLAGLIEKRSQDPRHSQARRRAIDVGRPATMPSKSHGNF